MYVIVSLGANCTCQLSLSVIRRTENAVAGCLNMVEQGSIPVTNSAGNALSIFVDTGEC